MLKLKIIYALKNILNKSMYNIFKKYYFFLIFYQSQVQALEFDGKFIQGHLIIGKTDPKTKIWIDKKRVKVTNDGYFVFGIGRDRKYDILITKEFKWKKRFNCKKSQKKRL